MNNKITIFVLCVFGSAFAGIVPIDPRVVNGDDAEIAEFPFMVSLRRNNGHSCAATILNEWWLLTAAHCIQSPVTQYSVQFANTVISRNGSNVIEVEQLIPHEGYLPANQYIHDIGLVKLKEPLRNPLHDCTVRLPPSLTYYPTGTPAVLAGWGLNGTDGVIMTHLQKVDLQVYSSYDCNEIHNSPVHYTNICGGIAGGWKGQCSGDSGGPLLVGGVQVGIVSWSVKPCTVPPYPGVYTGVSHYIDWIEQNTGLSLKLNLFLRAK